MPSAVLRAELASSAYFRHPHDLADRVQVSRGLDRQVSSPDCLTGASANLLRKNYSFKCHRYDIGPGTMPGTPAVSGSQHVFAVNDITFHKVEGTFCTAGADGSMTFWDGIARTKLKRESDPSAPMENGNPPLNVQPIVSRTSAMATQMPDRLSGACQWSPRLSTAITPSLPSKSCLFVRPISSA